ncbi:hypothetical protein AB0F72_08640 [Actinoplanes sp. NPDC023936]|uniref:hypothetical protein n=1 Tax=Actinoplanes sp. NPDC023936 TaxID=3154910 RepID=UPI0033D689E6
MTSTIPTHNALTAVHDTIRLAGDSGLTEPSISSLTGWHGSALQAVLDVGEARGVLSPTDGRWHARDLCRTCGYGANHWQYADTHPSSAACETDTADYAFGYPLPTD